MNELTIAIITGLTGIVSALIPTLIIYSRSQTLITYRLEQLENHVKEHNNLNERVIVLEEKTKHIENLA